MSFNQKRDTCQGRGVKQNAEFEVLPEMKLDGHGVQGLQWGPCSQRRPNFISQTKPRWVTWCGKHAWEGGVFDSLERVHTSKRRRCLSVQPVAVLEECRSQRAKISGFQRSARNLELRM